MSRSFFCLILLCLTLSSSFADDGTLLVVNRNDGTVSFIDVSNKVEVSRLLIGRVSPHELATSSDGQWAITGEYGSNGDPGRHLVIIDVVSASITSRIDLGPESRPHSLAFLADNRRAVVTAQDSDQLILVDIVTSEILQRYPTGGREGHMVKLSKDESQAYVSNRGGSGTLSIIWLNEDRPPKVIPTGRGAEGIAVSPDGEAIWVSNQVDRTITIVNADTLEVSATIDSPASNRIEFLPNGLAAVPGGANANMSSRNLYFYDTQSYNVANSVEFPGGSSGTGIRMLAENNVLFLSDSARNEISFLEMGLEKPPELITMNSSNVDGMAWSPLKVEMSEE